jgi:hypothetical protein
MDSNTLTQGRDQEGSLAKIKARRILSSKLIPNYSKGIKGKGVPVHMVAYRGSKGTAPLILKLGTLRRWVVI